MALKTQIDHCSSSYCSLIIKDSRNNESHVNMALIRRAQLRSLALLVRLQFEQNSTNSRRETEKLYVDPMKYHVTRCYSLMQRGKVMSLLESEQ